VSSRRGKQEEEAEEEDGKLWVFLKFQKSP